MISFYKCHPTKKGKSEAIARKDAGNGCFSLSNIGDELTVVLSSDFHSFF